MEELAADAKERLVKIEVRLEQMATKADIHEAANIQIKWLVGTLAVVSATAITIMTFVLNNAIPKAAATAAQQPAQLAIYPQSTPSAPAALAPPPAPSKKK